MIENGKGAIPVLVDLNNDGLKDLLVGSNFMSFLKSETVVICKMLYFIKYKYTYKLLNRSYFFVLLPTYLYQIKTPHLFRMQISLINQSEALIFIL
jgi:hypothetical protein